MGRVVRCAIFSDGGARLQCRAQHHQRRAAVLTNADTGAAAWPVHRRLPCREAVADQLSGGAMLSPGPVEILLQGAGPAALDAPRLRPCSARSKRSRIRSSV